MQSGSTAQKVDIEIKSVGIFRGNRVFFGGSCDLALGLLLIF